MGCSLTILATIGGLSMLSDIPKTSVLPSNANSWSYHWMPSVEWETENLVTQYSPPPGLLPLSRTRWIHISSPRSHCTHWSVSCESGHQPSASMRQSAFQSVPLETSMASSLMTGSFLLPIRGRMRNSQAAKCSTTSPARRILLQPLFGQCTERYSQSSRCAWRFEALTCAAQPKCSHATTRCSHSASCFSRFLNRTVAPQPSQGHTTGR
mmetsp:Transcript_47853/g.123517  ORF Transcript_47853/g.123517 Transcript_47853/m.123517 type:complete len:210 (+) Transcript_47853:189-818(+)